MQPGTYRLVLKIREYRLGSFSETGPGSGRRDLEPMGPEEARQTSFLATVKRG